MTLSGVRAEESADQREIILNPDSNWNLEYAKDYCSLRRSFGTSSGRVLVEIREYGPGGDADFLAVFDGVDFNPAEAVVRFPPHELASHPERGYIFETSEGLPGFFTSTFFGPVQDFEAQTEIDPSMVQAWASQTESIQIESRSRRSIIFETGSLHGVRSAMDECLISLVKYWGIDPETYADLIQNARPKHAKAWSRRISYPKRALRNNTMGALRIRMMIDAEGKPKNCHIIGAEATEDLSQGLCDSLMKYAKFEPALDENGKPTDGFYIMSLSFAIGPVRHLSF